MTKPELQAKYEETFGEKPKPQWSKPELEERINNADAENQISAKAEDAGEPGAEAGPGTGEIEEVGYSDISEPEYDAESDIKAAKQEEILQEINRARKVKDGKRHLVYKDDQEVWWTPAVIEVMYASFGPERIKFPENSEYILKNPKRCSTCG